MLSVTRDPKGDEAVYLAALNQCFPGWGDERYFAWCFARACNAPIARRLLVHEDGELLAGSAVTFREVVAPGRRFLAGIMTGSWTLPAARGKGCFSLVIEESLAMATESGAEALLAFVTEDNASFRRLAAAGSTLLETSYLVEPPGGPRPPGPDAVAAVDREAAIDALFQARTAAGATRFGYTREAWVGQLVDRVRPVEVLAVGAGYAVVEEKGDFLRVEAWCGDPGEVLAGLVRRARDRGRRLFGFTTVPAVRDAAERSGIALKPGFLTALGARPDRWDLQSGDRM